MNKVIMMGRLTKDPEIRATQSGTSIAHFSLAVDRRFKKEGDASADFFNCTTFGKQAEFCEKYLKKGTKILLSGRIENSTYTNKDGQKVTATGIVVEEVEFAESKKAEEKTEEKKTDWVPADDLDNELPFTF